MFLLKCFSPNEKTLLGAACLLLELTNLLKSLFGCSTGPSNMLMMPESEWLAQNAYLLSSWVKLSGTHWLALQQQDKPSVASMSFAWEETTLISPAPSAGHSVSELPQKCFALQQHTLLPFTAFSCDFRSHLPLLQGAALDSFELDSNGNCSRKTILILRNCALGTSFFFFSFFLFYHILLLPPLPPFSSLLPSLLLLPPPTPLSSSFFLF